MKDLTKLVLEYQKTKDENILTTILKDLKPLINKKATYLFYRQKFRKNNKEFYLNELGTLTLEDIRQELNLFTIHIINKYKLDSDFIAYYISSIWYWGRDLKNMSGDVGNVFLDDTKEITDKELTTQPNIELYNLEGVKMNYQEQRVMELLKENNQIKQSQIAERMGVTQSRVSQIIKKLRKKVKKYLT